MYPGLNHRCFLFGTCSARGSSRLCYQGDDRNAVDERGYTPLHDAAEQGSTRVVSRLLQGDEEVRMDRGVGEQQSHIPCSSTTNTEALIAIFIPTSKENTISLLQAYYSKHRVVSTSDGICLRANEYSACCTRPLLPLQRQALHATSQTK